MARFGCFSIRTVCRSCGLPVPVNGPVLTLACTECFDEMRLTPDTLAGFMNDFEEEYEGLSEGEGRSGTLMGGDGTFNYTYHRISPRCGSCGKSLEISSPAENSAFRCGGCGKLYHVAAVPEEYAKEVPSARFSITPEPLPESAAGKADENNGKKPEKPVVMACPQCGVALSLTAAAGRITGCRYCGAEVYVPDPVWLRLHPVKTAEDWIVWFEGKNRKQLESERRVKDLEEEKAELKAWRLRKGPAKRKGRFWPILAVIGGFFVVLIGFSLVLSYLGYEPEQIRSVMSRIGKPLDFPRH
ncbi:MAG: hypothetical protein E4H36_03125 [Spirochaetales bacterium]|nr:MAG: hypothetical protein E4H36_03125 [Spirochaetales bacterium]